MEICYDIRTFNRFIKEHDDFFYTECDLGVFIYNKSIAGALGYFKKEKGNITMLFELNNYLLGSNTCIKFNRLSYFKDFIDNYMDIVKKHRKSLYQFTQDTLQLAEKYIDT